MSNFEDDLRSSLDDDTGFEDEEPIEEDFFGSEESDSTQRGGFLGFTAVERAVVAFFGLLNVIALLAIILILTNRMSP